MADSGRSVPAIEQRPSLEGYEWLWQAFISLATCRQIGMTPGPIPWTAIQQYCAVHRLTDAEAYMLHNVIPYMDNVFLEQLEKSHGSVPHGKRNSNTQKKRSKR